jgi:ribosomal protein L24
MPIQISNLGFYDSVSKKPVKLGYKFNEKNKKLRIIKSTGKEV